MKPLNELADIIHGEAWVHGFYDHDKDNPSFLSEKLLLIVSEVVETQDALRDDNRELEAEEVADILIRTLDYAAYRKIDVDDGVARKMAKNAERPRLHGRVF